MDPTDLINYQNAIKSIESSGGNYGLTGPATRNGDRAYGAYQVMGNNIPSWTQKHYGQALTPQQFLANKDAQDAVFNGEFGGYVSKYGNPQDAASTWFTGRPQAQGGHSSDGYITGNQYVDKFNKALGGGPAPGGALAAINTAAPTGGGGGGMPQGALAFAGGAPTQPQAAASDAEDAPDTPSGVLFQGEKPNKLSTVGEMMANVASSLAGITNPGQAANLRTLATSIGAGSQGKYQYQMGANGQLVRIDKETGAVDSRAIPGSQKGNYSVVMGKDDNGNPIPVGSVNHDDGKFTSYGQQGTQTPGTPFGGDPSLTGQERYDSLTSDEKKQMDAWRNGTGIQPSQYSMRQPKMAKMVEAANAIGIDMTKYGERQAFLKGMASKNPTGAGGQFISAPTVMDHLENVANDYLGLGNSRGGGFSTGAAIANAYKDATGGTAREAQQTSADRNTDTAAKEIVSFLTRGHGGVTERQDTHNKLYMPRAAPEVQAAALEAYRKQVADRFYELADAAKGSVGEDHPEVMKAAAAFKAKDEALQQKIALLKSGGKAPGADTTATPQAAAPKLGDGWSYLGSK